MMHPMHRRKFIQSAAAGLALASVRSHAADLAALDKKKVALIGSGWYGKCDLLRLIQVAPVEVVALCDVDKRMLSDAAEIVASRQKSGKKPHLFTDYRQLLSEEELDLVLIDTPDHWHALPMIEAAQRGLDIWVQKPISVDVIEGQAMLAAARKYKNVVQVGTQRRSTPHLIDAKKNIIEEGRLGKIGLVEIYCYYHMRARQNPEDSQPPEHLDYEMWTGPAPMRPYNSLVHPRSWRAFMEYGNGIIGDMCIHMLDMVRWMLDLGMPERIHSTGGVQVQGGVKANITDTQSAVFDFGDLQVVWQHRSWGDAPDRDYPWGATFYGEKGTLKADVHKYDFIPRGNGNPVHKDVVFEFEQFPEDRDEKDLERHVAPAIRGHMLDWLAAVEKRTKPVADIEQGYISSTACILANISLQIGRSITWDHAAGRVVDDAEANELLARPYRKPWIHPTPESV